MTKEVLRYMVNLTPEQIQGVRFYLHRTTLLWNCMVHHLQEFIQEYMDEPVYEDSDGKMEKFVELLYEVLVHQKVVGEPYQLEERWLVPLRKIRELPASVMKNRVSDMVSLYLVGKKRKHELGEDPRRIIPQFKNNRSPQSVRFCSSDFMVTGEVIKILGQNPVEFRVPGIANEKIGGNTQLSITAKRVQYSDEDAVKLGHRWGWGYSVTLVNFQP